MKNHEMNPGDRAEFGINVKRLGYDSTVAMLLTHYETLSPVAPGDWDYFLDSLSEGIMLAFIEARAVSHG